MDTYTRLACQHHVLLYTLIAQITKGNWKGSWNHLNRAIWQ